MSGTNVLPFPPQQAPQPQQAGPPPGMMPNPAYMQWLQRAQQVQQIQQANAQKQAQFDAAVALIKRDGLHGFRLDIEADSTIAPDEEAEKAARVEFMQQFIPLMQQVVPIAQGNPPLASLAKEMTLFAVRGFRVARPMEEAIETAFDAIAQMPPAPQKGAAAGGTQKDPQIEQAKVAADVHDTQLKAQTDQMAIAQKAQQAQIQAAIADRRATVEEQRSQADVALQAAELAQRERLASARVEHLQAGAAGGLR